MEGYQWGGGGGEWGEGTGNKKHNFRHKNQSDLLKMQIRSCHPYT